MLGANVRVGGSELDLLVRRGRELRFVEVKERAGSGFGGAAAAVNAEKQRRVRRGASAWLVAHPTDCRVGFDVVAIEGRRVRRLGNAF